MAMSDAQEKAFKAASGNIDPSTLNLICIGSLITVLFLLGAWMLVQVYRGWANERVKDSGMFWIWIRIVLLLVVAIWMFAS